MMDDGLAAPLPSFASPNLQWYSMVHLRVSICQMWFYMFACTQEEIYQ